ncbi:MAG: hypothetical protein ACJ70T_04455, partial [Nitrososphaera sp.]
MVRLNQLPPPCQGVRKLDVNWQQFHNFLLQRMTAKTAEDRLRYSKQYADVLLFGIPNTLQQLAPNKRI